MSKFNHPQSMLSSEATASNGKNILIAITGSIAAFKMCSLISQLRKDNWNVQVLVSPAALEFIGRASLEGLSGREILDSDFISGKMMSHIDLARWADVFLIAPATAKTLNGLTAGTLEGIIGSTYLAFEAHKPLLIAPAMNSKMLAHPTTQNALHVLEKRGHTLLSPTHGTLACGEFGEGRMREPEDIYNDILLSVKPNNIQIPILITYGGTRVPIDNVRSITNTSRGTTGMLLAEALALQGCAVTTLSAQNAQRARFTQAQLFFDTYDDLVLQIERMDLSAFKVIIHLAAVSDFRVGDSIENQKLSSQKEISLQLVPTAKIISQIRKKNLAATLIGFKLTAQASQEQIDLAVQRVFSHGADYVVHNDTKNILETSHKFTLYGRGGILGACQQKQQLASLLNQFTLSPTHHSLSSPEVPYDFMS